MLTNLVGRRAPISFATLVAAILCASSAVAGEPPCAPAWSPAFGASIVADGDIRAMISFDDGLGDGPVLYVGGSFTMIGGVAASRIARWDGVTWSEVGGGVNGDVYAFTVASSGKSDGRKVLYVGGFFTTAGGEPANHIVRWDGSSWSDVGGGLNDYVSALLPVDGTGESHEIYVGGRFHETGDDVPMGRIARWTGSEWQPLGSGMANGRVLALALVDDGTGDEPSLIAGGTFGTAGGLQSYNVARWNGSSWSPMGAGFDYHVHALAVYDDGSGAGPQLYAAGGFSESGTQQLESVAKWNGTGWSDVGGGLVGGVTALAVFDAGGTPALYAGGFFLTAGGVDAPRVAMWDGSRWSAPPHSQDATGAPVLAFAVHDAGGKGNPGLYMGGIDEDGDVYALTVARLARWDGDSWTQLGSGLNGRVHALLRASTNPAGLEVTYMSGEFTSINGMPVPSIVSWDGTSFSTLDGGMNGPVYAFAVYDDGSGSGPAVYAGGEFTMAGGVPANNIAKWDGSAWSPLGLGVDGVVNTLTVFDAGLGDGPELFVGGEFNSAGGSLARSIARWNGTTWSKVGFIGIFGVVRTMKVFDGDPASGLGGAPALFVGGSFTSVDVYFMWGITKWDGVAWSALNDGPDPGLSGPVEDIEVFDFGAGKGSELAILGGFLEYSGPVRWDGSTFTTMPQLSSVREFAVFDDGSGGGPALYGGGGHTDPDYSSTRRVCKLVGSTWTVIVSHLDAPVILLEPRGGAPGRPPVLDVGGWFTTSPPGDSYLMHWQGCAEDAAIPGDINGDGVVDGNDLAIVLGHWGPCAGCSADLNGDGVVDGNDLAVVLGHWS